MAYVFMPNHIHLINLFNEGKDISNYMRDFKKFTSGEIRRKIEGDCDHELFEKVRYVDRRQKFKIWQDRFDDVWLESIQVLDTKMNYIHQNPVRKGIVQHADDYLYSSARFYSKGSDSFLRVANYLDVLGWGSHYYFGQIS